MRNELAAPQRPSSSLVDVLDRVLDKGLVVAGDIKVSLAEVELLTIRIRLIVCSLDKAQEIGLDWWRYDPHLAPGRRGRDELGALRERVQELEAELAQAAPRLSRRSQATGRRKVATRGRDGR